MKNASQECIDSDKNSPSCIYYYLYYLANDSIIIRDIWLLLTGQPLASSWEVNLFIPITPLLAQAPVQYPAILEGKCTARLYLYEQILIMELILNEIADETITSPAPRPHSQPPFNNEETSPVKQLRKVIADADPLRFRLGETLLFVRQSSFPPVLWDKNWQEEIKAATFNGSLYFSSSSTEEKHLYLFLFHPSSEEPLSANGSAINFLTSCLPLMEAKIFQHNIRMRFLRQRNKAILSEIRHVAQKVNNLLHTKLSSESNEKRVVSLETEITRLSYDYGTIAGYYRLLQESQNKLRNSFQQMIYSARRLFGSETETALNRYLQQCRQIEEEINDALSQCTMLMSDIKAALDVVRARVDLLHSRESITLQQQLKTIMDQNVLLQKESLTLQVAASFVEFIVIAYYSFSLWKYLSNPEIFHRIPSLLVIFLVVSFAGLAVLSTHFLAHDRLLSRRILLTIILLLIVIFLMVLLSSGCLFPI